MNHSQPNANGIPTCPMCGSGRAAKLIADQEALIAKQQGALTAAVNAMERMEMLSDYMEHKTDCRARFHGRADCTCGLAKAIGRDMP